MFLKTTTGKSTEPLSELQSQVHNNESEKQKLLKSSKLEMLTEWDKQISIMAEILISSKTIYVIQCEQDVYSCGGTCRYHRRNHLHCCGCSSS